MAGLINLKLLADFFNKIGPKRRFAAMQNTSAVGEGRNRSEVASSRSPIYELMAFSIPPPA